MTSLALKWHLYYYYVFFSAVQCPKSISNGQLSDSCSLDFGATCTSANCSYGYESSASFSITCTGASTWDDDTTVLCTGLYIENTRLMSFDIKFTMQGFENAC